MMYREDGYVKGHAVLKRTRTERTELRTGGHDLVQVGFLLVSFSPMWYCSAVPTVLPDCIKGGPHRHSDLHR
jgi:hypothetical protein